MQASSSCSNIQKDTDVLAPQVDLTYQTPFSAVSCGLALVIPPLIPMGALVPVTTSPCGLEYSVHSMVLSIFDASLGCCVDCKSYLFMQVAHEGTGQKFQ